MIEISEQHSNQLINSLYELISMLECHHDYLRPGKLATKQDELYQQIAYLRMGGEELGKE